jgi:DNA-binding MarR family transcriptional regulator
MSNNKLINILQLFREYENDIPVGTMLCFLHLMDKPGLTVSQVVSSLDMSKQSASRNLRNLTHRARPGKAGIDVARVEPDEHDYRVQCWHLNERGESLAKKIKQLTD